MNTQSPHITLTAEQADLIESSRCTVQLRDEHGKVVGFVQPIGFTEADIDEAVRRSEDRDGEMTTEELLSHQGLKAR